MDSTCTTTMSTQEKGDAQSQPYDQHDQQTWISIENLPLECATSDKLEADDYRKRLQQHFRGDIKKSTQYKPTLYPHNIGSRERTQLRIHQGRQPAGGSRDLTDTQPLGDGRCDTEGQVVPATPKHR